MQQFSRRVFIFLLLSFSYHLVRDVLQILGAHNFLADFLHSRGRWCTRFCDWITFPPEIFGIFGSIIVIRRNEVGLLGKFVAGLFVFWLSFWAIAYVASW